LEFATKKKRETEKIMEISLADKREETTGHGPTAAAAAPTDDNDRDVCTNRWILLTVEEMAGRASFYRALDGQRIGSIEVGLLPHEVRVTADGATAFVSAFGLHDYDSPLGRPGTSVVEIDVASMSVRRRLCTFAAGTPLEAANRAPHGVELSPDEKILYVNCEHAECSHGVVPSVLAYDLSAPAHHAATKEIALGTTTATTKPDSGPLAAVPIDHRCAQAHHLVASPDGRVLWMMAGTQGLGAIDVETGMVLSNESVLAPPQGAEALRGLCWSSSSQPSTPGATGQADRRGDVGPRLLLASGRDLLATVDPDVPAWVDVWRGFGVGQLLYSTTTPDGALILAPAVWNGLVIAVDAKTGALVRHIPTGLAPIHVAVSPDGRQAYVTNAYEAFITEIDLRSFATRRIITHSGPNGLAILPASAVPAAMAVPSDARVRPQPDIVLRLTVAVDMSGPAVPGRRHDVGCQTLAGASTWARAVQGDGGFIHLARGPLWKHADGGALMAVPVVDYADLGSDGTGSALASIVKDGAPYSIPSGTRAREIRVVVARTVGDTEPAVAEAHACAGSVVLVVLDPSLREGMGRRLGPWAWAVPADAPWGGPADALAHGRWSSNAAFDDAYWNKFHERPAPPAAVGLAGLCCVIESALGRAAALAGAAVDAKCIDIALEASLVHQAFCGTLALRTHAEAEPSTVVTTASTTATTQLLPSSCHMANL
jgi:sugar lactone lactonase YvrE